MRTPIEASRFRMSEIHHRFYPHLGPEDFYQNLIADILHFEDSLDSMGFKGNTRAELRQESRKLYDLDKATTATQKRHESQPPKG